MLLLLLGLLILIVIFLSRFVISRMRWSDNKAQRVFKKRNVPLAIQDTRINDHHIHYAETGNESLPALVFIHGSPGSWFYYKEFMWDPALREKYRIISFDRPGFGFSDFGKPLHLEEQCSLLLPVLRQLKKEPPMFLCGHSYGGPVVAKLAADAPDLFKTVVIVAGALDPALEKKEAWRNLLNKKPLSWFLPGAWQPSNTELIYLKKDLEPLAADLAKIITPVLFIHGDKDKLVPVENVAYGEKMMKNAAGITAHIIRDADHQLPWKKQQEFISILMRLE